MPVFNKSVGSSKIRRPWPPPNNARERIAQLLVDLIEHVLELPDHDFVHLVDRRQNFIAAGDQIIHLFAHEFIPVVDLSVFFRRVHVDVAERFDFRAQLQHFLTRIFNVAFLNLGAGVFIGQLIFAGQPRQVVFQARFNLRLVELNRMRAGGRRFQFPADLPDLLLAAFDIGGQLHLLLALLGQGRRDFIPAGIGLVKRCDQRIRECFLGSPSTASGANSS